MSTFILEANTRDVQGKGASCRLRRLENKVPAIVYGGDKATELLILCKNKVSKILESEAFYSSVFDLVVDGKPQQVILKALQRHPYKPVIMHMDFQRVSAQDVLTRMVPLHFVNGEKCEGHIMGGVVSHSMTQVEIKCKAKDLPEFIEVDLINLKLDDVLHLSHIKLPKNVSLAVDVTDIDHDLPVVGVHISKAALSEEAADALELEEESVELEEISEDDNLEADEE